MTFLELCQMLARESGSTNTTITTVAGQTGWALHLVNWVNSAYLDIQRKRDWLFMRGSFTVNTVAADGIYAYGDCTDTATSAAITNFREWDKDTLKIYLTSGGVNGEIPLTFMDYASWYAIYNTGVQVDSYSAFFTVDNQRRLRLAPIPGAVYTVTGEYVKSAASMSVNSDVPILPAEYHEAIVYRALMKYGRYHNAPEVYEDGKSNYFRILGEMERTQLPEIELG